MKKKVRNVTVAYPENMDELMKRYSNNLAKVITKITPLHQAEELIKRIKYSK